MKLCALHAIWIPTFCRSIFRTWTKKRSTDHPPYVNCMRVAKCKTGIAITISPPYPWDTLPTTPSLNDTSTRTSFLKKNWSPWKKWCIGTHFSKVQKFETLLSHCRVNFWASIALSHCRIVESTFGYRNLRECFSKTMHINLGTTFALTPRPPMYVGNCNLAKVKLKTLIKDAKMCHGRKCVTVVLKLTLR
jgi:hypothetical protein